MFKASGDFSIKDWQVGVPDEQASFLKISGDVDEWRGGRLLISGPAKAFESETFVLSGTRHAGTIGNTESKMPIKKAIVKQDGRSRECGIPMLVFPAPFLQ